MVRTTFALALLIALAPVAAAQDMPLSDLLIEGEVWKKVEGKPEKPKRVDPLEVMGRNGRPERVPIAAVRSAAGDTIFVIYNGDSSIWAYPADEKGIRGPGARYMTPRGRPNGSVLLTGGLTVDKDGRIYSATEFGVQVLDPTGRLCGVMTQPPQTFPTHLAFEGDQLVMWASGERYTRKLNTTGVK